MLSQQGRKEENGLMILSRNTWNPEIAASQFLKRKDGCVMEHAP